MYALHIYTDLIILFYYVIIAETLGKRTTTSAPSTTTTTTTTTTIAPLDDYDDKDGEIGLEEADPEDSKYEKPFIDEKLTNS